MLYSQRMSVKLSQANWNPNVSNRVTSTEIGPTWSSLDQLYARYFPDNRKVLRKKVPTKSVCAYRPVGTTAVVEPQLSIYIIKVEVIDPNLGGSDCPWNTFCIKLAPTATESFIGYKCK